MVEVGRTGLRAQDERGGGGRRGSACPSLVGGVAKGARAGGETGGNYEEWVRGKEEKGTAETAGLDGLGGHARQASTRIACV